jgi:hypothetical protein
MKRHITLPAGDAKRRIEAQDLKPKSAWWRRRSGIIQLSSPVLCDPDGFVLIFSFFISVRAA